MDEEHKISTAVKEFIIDRRARRLSMGTVDFYLDKLALFQKNIPVNTMGELTPPLIRGYLQVIQENHNQGGVHAAWRALKTFLNWYEREAESWKNPIRKVSPPRAPQQVIPGVKLDEVQRMIETCGRDKYGQRDHALLLFLLDTGLRRAEILALNLDDVDLLAGALRVRSGKGGKPRTGFLSSQTCQETIRYLKRWHRDYARLPGETPLWVTKLGVRMENAGLRRILERRAELAGLDQVPSPHDFRRAFALESLRNGIDIVSLSRLMGHSSTNVLARYLAQNDEDLKQKHDDHSPLDGLM